MGTSDKGQYFVDHCTIGDERLNLTNETVEGELGKKH